MINSEAIASFIKKASSELHVWENDFVVKYCLILFFLGTLEILVYFLNFIAQMNFITSIPIWKSITFSNFFHILIYFSILDWWQFLLIAVDLTILLDLFTEFFLEGKLKQLKKLKKEDILKFVLFWGILCWLVYSISNHRIAIIFLLVIISFVVRFLLWSTFLSIWASRVTFDNMPVEEKGKLSFYGYKVASLISIFISGILILCIFAYTIASDTDDQKQMTAIICSDLHMKAIVSGKYTYNGWLMGELNNFFLTRAKDSSGFYSDIEIHISKIDAFVSLEDNENDVEKKQAFPNCFN